MRSDNISMSLHTLITSQPNMHIKSEHRISGIIAPCHVWIDEHNGAPEHWNKQTDNKPVCDVNKQNEM